MTPLPLPSARQQAGLVLLLTGVLVIAWCG